nr:hypothetical protein [Tanacetum cinerariifolium]
MSSYNHFGCSWCGGPFKGGNCPGCSSVGSGNKVFEIKDAFGNKQYKPEDIQELFRKLLIDVQNIQEELAEYINTPCWNRASFYNNDEDDDEDYTYAIIPDFLITDSLIMGTSILTLFLKRNQTNS